MLTEINKKSNINIMEIRTLSPLRYPGGKAFMTDFLTEFIKDNYSVKPVYVEPYAGGAGAALNLLFNGTVDKILINDANIAIFSFWDNLINNTQKFLRKFDSVTPTLEEWMRQRDIFNKLKNISQSNLDLAFAVFFLNRTSRSGVLGSGPIGGITLDQQKKAKYNISARYNKSNLRKRLLNIAEQRKNIEVSNLDALDLLKKILVAPIERQKKVFIYLDPPYYEKGKKLYMDFYNYEDHKALASFLDNSYNFKWILSYDSVLPIKELYSSFKQYEFAIRYSVNLQKQGKELIVHSRNSFMERKVLSHYSKDLIFLEGINSDSKRNLYR